MTIEKLEKRVEVLKCIIRKQFKNSDFNSGYIHIINTILDYIISEESKDILINSDKILVVDINVLPAEYKDKDTETVRQSLEVMFGVKVLVVDNSRQNIQGVISNKESIYFVK